MNVPAGVVFKDAFLTIHDGTVSTDISTFLTEAQLTMGPDQVEDTAVGDSTHTFVDGLQNHAIRATVKMGYGAGSPEAVLSPIILSGTEIAVEMRRSRLLAVGVANPRFTLGSLGGSFAAGAKIVGPEFAPVGGRVGELVTSSILIVPISGKAIVRSEQ